MGQTYECTEDNLEINNKMKNSVDDDDKPTLEKKTENAWKNISSDMPFSLTSSLH